ncbi:MAG: fluoride efflux transporter CrcB [Acidimicrobiia bacterium]
MSDRFPVRTVAAVAIGGALGTSARYWLGRVAPVAPGTFPTTTLVINLGGSFLLGILLGSIARWRRDDELLRPLLGIGVLGGFTTFSTFAVETVQLGRAHHPLLAAAYVVASIAGGLVAARLGATVLRARLAPEGES